MAKRPTQLDKAIQNLDAQIAALQLARQALVQQRTGMAVKPVAAPRTRPVEKIG
jgi:multidrug efflux pump subunit AcrA (membrane-fusion protein)